MASDDLLQRTIERFWDTVPPVWGRVRGNARCNAIQDFNLTLIQFHILRHIRHGIHSVGGLAEKQQISRPAISQAVETLVEKGLVIRLPDAQDRRYVRLELTESATELLEVVFSKNRQWMAKKMASLKQDELETIMTAMEILKRTFDPIAQ
ncbi:MAG: MarR family winged helix-turn-helix transcriptional regulator [Anaerolineaceae bacterium]